jgi:hypothetical protein
MTLNYHCLYTYFANAPFVIWLLWMVQMQYFVQSCNTLCLETDVLLNVHHAKKCWKGPFFNHTPSCSCYIALFGSSLGPDFILPFIHDWPLYSCLPYPLMPKTGSTFHGNIYQAEWCHTTVNGACCMCIHVLNICEFEWTDARLVVVVDVYGNFDEISASVTVYSLDCTYCTSELVLSFMQPTHRLL